MDFPWQGDVMAAVSGGADSVALLLLLISCRDEGRITLRAVHVNHGIRGEASDGDELFVRRLCERYAVPLDCVRLRPPEHASENWAREARYQAFEETCRARNIRMLALAHHRDDQAETVLLHLIRGTGLKGLCGMRRETERNGITLIRPLLDFSRQDLRAFLMTRGETWREDATNHTDLYLRNRVRHELLPKMEEMNPGIAARIASSSRVWAEEEDYMEEVAAGWLDEHPGSELPLKDLLIQPKAIQRRVLRGFVHRETGLTADLASTERMLLLIHAETGTETDALQGVRLYRGRTHIHLLRKLATPAGMDIRGIGEYSMNGVTLRISKGGIGPGNGKKRQEFPESLLKDCILRTWLPGDVIVPFGSKGHQSLQDYFVNRRVDRPFRHRIPLICRGQEVLLVCGIGSGGIPKWQPEGSSLSVSVEGDLPWMNV